MRSTESWSSSRQFDPAPPVNDGVGPGLPVRFVGCTLICHHASGSSRPAASQFWQGQQPPRVGRQAETGISYVPSGFSGVQGFPRAFSMGAQKFSPVKATAPRVESRYVDTASPTTSASWPAIAQIYDGVREELRAGWFIGTRANIGARSFEP